jgi:HSP20 family protein
MSQLLPERSRTGSEGLSPLNELGQLNERMRRMLEQTFGGMLDEPAGWIPAVDIEELEDAYVVEAEVPGVKRDDVNLEVSGNELTISGEIKIREREGIIRRRTRRVG